MTVAADTQDVLAFWAKLKEDFVKAKSVWTIISSPQTRALMVKVFNQTVTTVKAAVTAGESEGLNVQLDSTVVADVKELIADAQAGDKQIVADLKAIGIEL